MKIVNPYKSSGNILSWGPDAGSPRQAGSPRALPEASSGLLPPQTDKQREQQEIENQIAHLDREVIKVPSDHPEVKAELVGAKSLAQNGLTLRKKRLAEEKIEELEKERRALRGRLKTSIASGNLRHF